MKNSELPQQFPQHPRGTQARVLLTSVFGPYAQDDSFGSRTINPMELYHNQVTRAQGSFSLRMFHRSWGIMMIQQNITAPCTVLDFPTIEKFEKELTSHHYDIVGVSSIIANVGKVREMCKRIRKLSPHSQIIIGGHVAAIPGLSALIDADHIVKGEGIAWMRRYLGESVDAPVKHPALLSAFDMRVMGIKVPDNARTTAATVVPSVGCPLGCNFCTTSAFFGGKGKSVDFLRSGDEIFEVMGDIERRLNTKSFFIMDENFLLNRPRALRLLERMKAENRSWALYVFSSANAIKKYTIDELVQLGISWIWMGLESPKSTYTKLKDTDTQVMAAELRKHGIKLLGSTIVGLEHHTPENIRGEIEFAISHGTDFHQFMLYTPVPGTPLHQEMEEQGRMLPGVDPADIHGQFKFNFKHAAISREESKKFLDWAFLRDFERNGPSIFRICETMLQGWKRHKNDPDPRVRERFRWEMHQLKGTYNAALWVMEKRLKRVNESVATRIRSLRQDVEKEFGAIARFNRLAVGPILLWAAKREERRLAAGKTYEPRTFIERRNWVEA
jgi:radical SAM superfamily enzyme YgiQ (UPF0313 family)